jgi:hypothetical protein
LFQEGDLMIGHFVFGNVTATYNIMSADCLFVKGGSLALPDEASCSWSAYSPYFEKIEVGL